MHRTSQDRRRDQRREQQIGQVLNEFLDRRARGERVNQAALLAAHPDLADELREHLGFLRELSPGTQRVADLVALGVLAPAADDRYLAELGPYRISGFLGSGGMGIVLKASDPKLDRTIVLKILRPELSADPAALSRFEREARAVAALRHPNIVTVHAVGTQCGVPYMTMEYVPGETLAAVLHRAAPLPPEMIRQVFAQVLAGLAAAHEAGLVHRDIKPSNILLNLKLGEDAWGLRSADSRLMATDDGSPSGLDRPQSGAWSPFVKIADFGLARIRTAQTQLTLPNAVLGTPEYMSPEQARGQADVDHRTDLYSAGVVLYEMLTGQSPFKANSPTATLNCIMTRTPPPPRQLCRTADRTLGELALRLLEKRPEDRFASAAAALETLEAHARVAQPTRRRRVRRVAAATAAGAVILAGAAWGVTRLIGSVRPPTLPESTVPTAVWIDEHDDTTLLARYGHDAPARVFRTFARQAESVRHATLVDVDGRGTKCIAVAIVPKRAAGNILLYDAHGEELWSRYLASDLTWPDCAGGKVWRGAQVVAHDLDGNPGDELVAVAKDAYEYPCRVSVLDARSGKVRSTFWHMGHIDVSVAPDFFGPGHAALLGWGLANKLDGFYEPQVGDPPSRTRYDLVSVAMILDPWDMDGLAPPYTDRVPGIPPARLYAYAFLDQPGSVMSTYVPEGRTQAVRPDAGQVVAITGLAVNSDGAADGSGPRLVAHLHFTDRPGPGSFLLDETFNILDMVIASGQGKPADKEHWAQFWHPLYQRGQPVAGD